MPEFRSGQLELKPVYVNSNRNLLYADAPPSLKPSLIFTHYCVSIRSSNTRESDIEVTVSDTPGNLQSGVVQ